MANQSKQLVGNDKVVHWKYYVDVLTTPEYEPYIRWTGNHLEFVFIKAPLVYAEFDWRKAGNTATLGMDPMDKWRDNLMDTVKVKGRFKGLREYFPVRMTREMRLIKPVIEKVTGLECGYRFLSHEHICTYLGWSQQKLLDYIAEVAARNPVIPKRKAPKRRQTEDCLRVDDSNATVSASKTRHGHQEHFQQNSNAPTGQLLSPRSLPFCPTVQPEQTFVTYDHSNQVYLNNQAFHQPLCTQREPNSQHLHYVPLNCTSPTHDPRFGSCAVNRVDPAPVQRSTFPSPTESAMDSGNEECDTPLSLSSTDLKCNTPSNIDLLIDSDYESSPGSVTTVDCKLSEDMGQTPSSFTQCRKRIDSDSSDEGYPTPSESPSPSNLSFDEILEDVQNSFLNPRPLTKWEAQVALEIEELAERSLELKLDN